jgi:nucleotide-binding universal stress UspA family protein
MLHRLLVPLDGSEPAEAALPMVAFLARQAGAQVILLHVVEQHAPATVHGHHHITGAAEAESYLADVQRRCFPPEVSVVRHVHRRETGDVAHSLADHADELESDLVIMLAHGPTSVRRWWSGTLAQQVVRQNAAPILLLHPGPDGKILVPLRQLLVPLDGRPEHESGLPLAVELARLSSAPIRLLMVVPSPGDLHGPDAATGQFLPTATREMLETLESEGAQYLEQQLQHLQAEGVTASAAVARGEPASVISEMARTLKADLIVLGTHGTAGIEAFWTGSLGQRLIGSVPVSFLLALARPAGEPP